jgi:hypothetical protein
MSHRTPNATPPSGAGNADGGVSSGHHRGALLSRGSLAALLANKLVAERGKQQLIERAVTGFPPQPNDDPLARWEAEGGLVQST